MNHVIGEQLWEHVLGTHDDAAVRAHLAACAECRLEEARVADALAAAALLAEAEAPSPSLRLRLEESLGGTPLAYESFAERLAAFFVLTVDEVRRLLLRARSAAAWQPAPLPGMSLFHLRAGAAYATADAGLVRYDPNAVFPDHLHVGEERSLMVFGRLRIHGGVEDGRLVVPGDEILAPAGSTHGFTVLDEGCVFAVTLFNGIRIGDVELTASTKTLP